MINKVVISDTSCLVAFDRINKLDIIRKTFPTIITTEEVAEEFGKPFPLWISIIPVKNQIRKKELENVIDRGEASAISLALETKDCILIIDERKGRKLARDLGIEIIGSLKILLLAKQNGVIKSVKEIIIELEYANFRISKTLLKEILTIAGEA